MAAVTDGSPRWVCVYRFRSTVNSISTIHISNITVEDNIQFLDTLIVTNGNCTYGTGARRQYIDFTAHV